MKGRVANILTVDVEDYFQVEGFADVIAEADWDRYEVRFQRGLEWLLQILDSARIKATFFVLGWIAERYPQAIREIARKEHEIGVHGYTHRRVDAGTPEAFEADLRRALAVFADLGLKGVQGHRAPSFSLTRQTHQAWDVLKACGLSYDASLSVIHFAPGQAPWCRPDPGPQEANGLKLFPQGYLPWGPRLPFAGGGYFRLYPYWITRRGIAAWNRRGVPVTVYVHPWEFDPEQPRVEKAGGLSRFKHTVNLDINREKFARLLQDFSFISCRDALRR